MSTHPDFERLTEVMHQQLSMTAEVVMRRRNGDNQAAFEVLLDPIVDKDAMVEFIMPILGKAAEQVAERLRADEPLQMLSMLIALYAQGFLDGTFFERLGGHREPQGGEQG